MQVIILGAGGHGKVVLDVLIKAKFKVIGFLDDRIENAKKIIHKVKILGPISQLENLTKNSLGVIVAIGDNFIRESIYNKAKKLNFTLIKAVHPKTYLHKSVKVGAGTVIMPNAVINIDSLIGENCIINTGAIIEHDCVIKNHTHISTGARLTGGVYIGEGVLIGAGAVILPKVKIGEKSIVGAGSIVLNNVPAYTIAAGNPAKIIKKINLA